MTALTLALILSTAATSEPNKQSVPQLLRDAVLRRLNLRKGELRWSVVKNKDSPARTMYYTGRFAKQDYLSISHGDMNGVRFPDQVGEPLSCGNSSLLMKGGEQWIYDEDSLRVGVVTQPNAAHPYFDVRTAGLFARYMTRTGVQDAIPEPLTHWAETETPDGILVVGEDVQAGVRSEWLIDPARENSIIASRIIKGAVSVESKCDLRQYDGIWYPERVRYFRDGQLTHTLEVLSATFEQPELPDALTPNDLGLFPGINVVREGHAGPLAWDGEKETDFKDFFTRVRAGEIDRSQSLEVLERHRRGEFTTRFPRPLNAESFGMVNVASQYGLWEEYTRRFMIRYRLDTEQRGKAWKELRRCQRRAAPYRSNARPHALRSGKAASAPASSQPSPVLISQRKSDNSRNLERIFEKDLKPSLHGLLRPQQRDTPSRAPTVSRP